MAELKQVAISEIALGERLRPIDEEHAKAIAISVAEIGLINPITVRPTPASRLGNYTLVAGGHRLRAAEICGLTTIDVIVIQSSKPEAEIVEISENFYRNELSKLDRAIFVGRLREIWEARNGAINPKGGRPKKNAAQFAEFFEGKFSEYVADRLGVSKRTAQALDEISRKIDPRLRAKIRGTPAADNLTTLRRLKRYTPSQQAGIVSALEIEGDLTKVLAISDPSTERPPKGRQERKAWNMGRFTSAWSLMSTADQDAALAAIGAMRKPLDNRPALPDGPKMIAPPLGSMVPMQLPAVAVAARGMRSPLWDFCQLPFEQRVEPANYADWFKAQRLEQERQARERLEEEEMLQRIREIEAAGRPAYKEAQEKDKRLARRRAKAKKANPEAEILKPHRKVFNKLAGVYNRDIARALILIMVGEEEQPWVAVPGNYKSFRSAGGKFTEEQFRELLSWLECDQPDSPAYFVRRVRWMIEDWERDTGTQLEANDEEHGELAHRDTTSISKPLQSP